MENIYFGNKTKREKRNGWSFFDLTAPEQPVFLWILKSVFLFVKRQKIEQQSKDIIFPQIFPKIFQC